MDTELKRIKKLTLFMKKEGLISIKSKDLELNLSPAALIPDDSSKTQEQAPPIDSEPQYSAEDILMWSAPGFVPTPEDVN